MPKLDSQSRILVPIDLRESVGLDTSNEIAICYNFQNDTFTFFNKEDVDNNCIISIRKFDSKGRISLSNDVLELLGGLKKDDFIIIFVQNNKLCMKGMAETGTWFQSFL